MVSWFSLKWRTGPAESHLFGKPSPGMERCFPSACSRLRSEGFIAGCQSRRGWERWAAQVRLGRIRRGELPAAHPSVFWPLGQRLGRFPLELWPPILAFHLPLRATPLGTRFHRLPWTRWCRPQRCRSLRPCQPSRRYRSPKPLRRRQASRDRRLPLCPLPRRVCQDPDRCLDHHYRLSRHHRQRPGPRFHPFHHFHRSLKDQPHFLQCLRRLLFPLCRDLPHRPFHRFHRDPAQRSSHRLRPRCHPCPQCLDLLCRPDLHFPRFHLVG